MLDATGSEFNLQSVQMVHINRIRIPVFVIIGLQSENVLNISDFPE